MMALKTRLLVLVAAVACVAAAFDHLERPLAKVSVRVVNENQAPIGGAAVKVDLRNRLTGADVFVTRETDSDGRFTAEGGATPASIGNEITKDGYYEGWVDIPKFSKIDSLTNHCLPWNQTYTTVLRPIGTPVALYAKSTWATLPAAGQPCGYDLQVGDWVAPSGKGKIADLLLTYSGHFVNLDDVDVAVTLRFSNPGDGIQPAGLPAEWAYSAFRWPRAAPETGYTPTHVSHFGHASRSANFDINETDQTAYWFRVRTVEKNGHIVSALYGKIRGGLALAPHGQTTCSVHLRYYLNPTPLDRNLEWDPKRDLLPGLRYDERPREP